VEKKINFQQEGYERHHVGGTTMHIVERISKTCGRYSAVYKLGCQHEGGTKGETYRYTQAVADPGGGDWGDHPPKNLKKYFFCFTLFHEMIGL